MKRKFGTAIIGIFAVIALVCAFASCSSGDDDPPPKKPTVTSIEVTSRPTKTLYAIGESLDTAGMVVKANYSNNKSENVTGYLIDFNSSSVGIKPVTISYSGKSAAPFNVSVYDPDIAPVFSLYQWLGDKNDDDTLGSGSGVRPLASSSSSCVIKIVMNDDDGEGVKICERTGATYHGLDLFIDSTGLNLNCAENLYLLSVSGHLTGTPAGDGMQMVLHDQNSNVFKFTGSVLTQADQEFSVSCILPANGNDTTRVRIRAQDTDSTTGDNDDISRSVEIVVTDITVINLGERPALAGITADYTQTETVFPDTPINDLKKDLTVTANYVGGTSEEVTTYTLTGTLAAPSSPITVTYNGETTTFTVNVTARTLTSITAVYTQGEKKIYEETSLTALKTDLVVTANYSDNTSKPIAAAEYALSGTLSVGQSTVTVTFEEQTTTFTVDVSETPSGITYVFNLADWIAAHPQYTGEGNSIPADGSSNPVIPSSPLRMNGTVPSSNYAYINAEGTGLVALLGNGQGIHIMLNEGNLGIDLTQKTYEITVSGKTLVDGGSGDAWIRMAGYNGSTANPPPTGSSYMFQTAASRTVGGEFSFSGELDAKVTTSLRLTGSSGSATMVFLITEIKITEKKAAALWSLADWITPERIALYTDKDHSVGANSAPGLTAASPLRMNSTVPTSNYAFIKDNALILNINGGSAGVHISIDGATNGTYSNLDLNTVTNKYQLIIDGEYYTDGTGSASPMFRVQVYTTSATLIEDVPVERVVGAKFSLDKEVPSVAGATSIRLTGSSAMQGTAELKINKIEIIDLGPR
ncbi:MAG: bacterial Ig-like domain-containing protein [Treponema sp.]|jgi:hypothetical protein|nr:bacterial Ig-like domain-containing protein [Treponema sp.]